MLPLKKTNVNECIKRSSSTSSTDYTAVMHANVPRLYTDSIHRYSIQTFIKNISVSAHSLLCSQVHNINIYCNIILKCVG